MIEIDYRRKRDCASVACIIAVAQEGNFYVKGEVGTWKSVVLAHVAAKLARSVGHLAPIQGDYEQGELL